MKVPVHLLITFLMFLFIGTGSAFSCATRAITPHWQTTSIKDHQIDQTHSVELLKGFRTKSTSQDLFEAESDENNLVLVKQDIWLVSYFIALAAIFLVLNTGLYHKNALPFCAYLSKTATTKYIIQRVLRI